MPKISTNSKRVPGQNRVPTMLRCSPVVREKLQAEADAAGRSLSQEMELRLERSLDADLIQKAVADGIAAHEAAKAEKMRAGWVTGPHGTYAAQNVQGGYPTLYSAQAAQNS